MSSSRVRELGRASVLGAGFVMVATSTAACSSPEPSAEMTRAATLVLGASVADGTKRLGECLAEAGFDIDRDEIASHVKRGNDVQLASRTESIYQVAVDGPEDLSFDVAYESGYVFARADHDKQELKELGCALPEYE